jgi:hypothetical protein
MQFLAKSEERKANRGCETAVPYNHEMRRGLLAAAGFLCFASCLALGQGLEIQEVSGQGAIMGEEYVLTLEATGGVAPYTWHLVDGELPPGCKLHHRTGKISGVPTTAGVYHFTIAVQDSDIPKSELKREFTVRVIEGLMISWNDPPKIHGHAISGSATVTNQTPLEMVVTFIVVAVNDVGRATALGYQHFTLAAQATSPVIPFGSSPGPGTYYIRADAVAHRPGKHHMYRVNKETREPMKVTQF